MEPAFNNPPKECAPRTRSEVLRQFFPEAEELLLHDTPETCTGKDVTGLVLFGFFAAPNPAASATVSELRRQMRPFVGNDTLSADAMEYLLTELVEQGVVVLSQARRGNQEGHYRLDMRHLIVEEINQELVRRTAAIVPGLDECNLPKAPQQPVAPSAARIPEENKDKHDQRLEAAFLDRVQRLLRIALATVERCEDFRAWSTTEELLLDKPTAVGIERAVALITPRQREALRAFPKESFPAQPNGDPIVDGELSGLLQAVSAERNVSWFSRKRSEAYSSVVGGITSAKNALQQVLAVDQQLAAPLLSDETRRALSDFHDRLERAPATATLTKKSTPEIEDGHTFLWRVATEPLKELAPFTEQMRQLAARFVPDMEKSLGNALDEMQLVPSAEKVRALARAERVELYLSKIESFSRWLEENSEGTRLLFTPPSAELSTAVKSRNNSGMGPPQRAAGISSLWGGVNTTESQNGASLPSGQEPRSLALKRALELSSSPPAPRFSHRGGYYPRDTKRDRAAFVEVSDPGTQSTRAEHYLALSESLALIKCELWRISPTLSAGAAQTLHDFQKLLEPLDRAMAKYWTPRGITLRALKDTALWTEVLPVKLKALVSAIPGIRTVVASYKRLATE